MADFSNGWKKVFQWLENPARFFQWLEKNFPMVGKICPFFPMIGKIFAWFSNDWKNFSGSGARSSRAGFPPPRPGQEEAPGNFAIAWFPGASRW
ncbi:MAG: hypothetical protein IKQ15_09320 [Kiritimatiellae bacterium]|nr:hypothetical protein [Kiritimatiellia bacterium]